MYFMAIKTEATFLDHELEIMNLRLRCWPHTDIITHASWWPCGRMILLKMGVVLRAATVLWLKIQRGCCDCKMGGRPMSLAMVRLHSWVGGGDCGGDCGCHSNVCSSANNAAQDLRGEGMAHPRTPADYQDIDTGSGTDRYWTSRTNISKSTVGYGLELDDSTDNCKRKIFLFYTFRKSRLCCYYAPCFRRFRFDYRFVVRIFWLRHLIILLSYNAETIY